MRKTLIQYIAILKMENGQIEHYWNIECGSILLIYCFNGK